MVLSTFPFRIPKTWRNTYIQKEPLFFKSPGTRSFWEEIIHASNSNEHSHTLQIFGNFELIQMVISFELINLLLYPFNSFHTKYSHKNIQTCAVFAEAIAPNINNITSCKGYRRNLCDIENIQRGRWHSI